MSNEDDEVDAGREAQTREARSEAESVASLLPVLAEVRTILEGAGLSPSQTAAWFETRTGWLDDHAPAELLDAKPHLVLEAAKRQHDLPFF